MFKTLLNAWRIPDVRKRLIFTFLMMVVIRVGAQIPVPGTDPDVVKTIFQGLTSGAFNIFNTFTGGSLESFSILALSITPYITASIIMELLTIAIPPLEELAREGNEGRKKIAEYTRYATVALALIEATAMAIPGKELGCATLLMCESKQEKVSRLLKAAEYIEDVHDELIERYFLDVESYFNEGYQL